MSLWWSSLQRHGVGQRHLGVGAQHLLDAPGARRLGPLVAELQLAAGIAVGQVHLVGGGEPAFRRDCGCAAGGPARSGPAIRSGRRRARASARPSSAGPARARPRSSRCRRSRRRRSDSPSGVRHAATAVRKAAESVGASCSARSRNRRRRRARTRRVRRANARRRVLPQHRPVAGEVQLDLRDPARPSPGWSRAPPTSPPSGRGSGTGPPAWGSARRRRGPPDRWRRWSGRRRSCRCGRWRRRAGQARRRR